MALPVDDVVLTLGGEALRITQGYEIRAGIFQQPAGFALRLGHGGVVADLFQRYPNNTPFSLSVNGNPFQSGFTDGKVSGESSGASEATFEGRDPMARVVKAFVHAEMAFQGITYAELTEQVLALCGLVGYTRANGKLSVSNEANRRRISGKQIVETKPPSVDKADFSITGDPALTRRFGTGQVQQEDVEVTVFRNAVPGTTKTVYRTVKVTMGTKWHEGFLKPLLDRGGLFLWATSDGGFILSTPNANQEPAAQIVRIKRGEAAPGGVRVVRHSFRDDTKERYSKWVVYGRGGGRETGRWKTQAEFVDQEMAAILGHENAVVNTHHDNACDTLQKCEHLARRRCAEANRSSWSLTYTLSGHSTLGRKGRYVWTPDTVVEVDDREIGVRGNFYVESVAMNCNPQKTTTVRLMKPADLVFGTADEAAA